MRIGILGTGSSARTHASAYAQMSDVEIAAIVGRSKSTTQRLSTLYGASATTDPLTVLNDNSIDAIDVTYPTFMHCEYAIAALERGHTLHWTSLSGQEVTFIGAMEVMKRILLNTITTTLRRS